RLGENREMRSADLFPAVVVVTPFAPLTILPPLAVARALSVKTSSIPRLGVMTRPRTAFAGSSGAEWVTSVPLGAVLSWAQPCCGAANAARRIAGLAARRSFVKLAAVWRGMA